MSPLNGEAYLAVKGAYLAVKGGRNEWISESDRNDIYLCNDLEPLQTDIHISHLTCIQQISILIHANLLWLKGREDPLSDCQDSES